MADPKLQAQYGDIWDKIADIRGKISKVTRQSAAFRLRGFINSDYFMMANEIVKIAKQINMPDSLRDFAFKGFKEEDLKTKKFFSPEFDASLSTKKLAFKESILTNLTFLTNTESLPCDSQRLSKKNIYELLLK